MFNLKWKALGDALYSQDAVVTAVKGGIILALWGAARDFHH